MKDKRDILATLARFCAYLGFPKLYPWQIETLNPFMDTTGNIIPSSNYGVPIAQRRFRSIRCEKSEREENKSAAAARLADNQHWVGLFPKLWSREERVLHPAEHKLM